MVRSDQDRIDLNKTITELQLMKVARNLGHEWREIGILYLEMSSTDIDRFETENKSESYTIFLMLHTWKCRAKEKATVLRLVNILKEANVRMEAWEFLSPKHDSTDLRCKCCNSISCKCQCNLVENETILDSAPVSNGLPCTIKCEHNNKIVLSAVDLQHKLLQLIDQLLIAKLHEEEELRLDIRETFHKNETEIYKMRSGCIEFHLLILSYGGLLNCSEDRRFLLNSLHRKIEHILRKHLAGVNTIGTFSFVNNFEGGSYKKALEFFTRGHSIDDMLPIVNKKIKYQRVIDYLCIDMKTMRRSTLNDLRSDFLKQRNRKLCELQRKVEISNFLNNSDRNLILKLIEIGSNGVRETTVCDLTSQMKRSEKDKAQNQTSRTKTSKRKAKKCKTPKTPVGKESKSYGSETQVKKAKQKHSPEMKTANLEKSGFRPLVQKSKSNSKPESPVDKVETTTKSKHPVKKMKLSHAQEIPTKQEVSSLKIEVPVEEQESVSKLKAKQDDFKTSKGKKRALITSMKKRRSQIPIPAGTSFYSDTPRRFQVVNLNSLKQKPMECYGCLKPLMNDQGNNSFVLRTQDTRDFFKGEKSNLAFESSNAYFHFQMECILKKCKDFHPHSVKVPNDLWGLLSCDQQAFLTFSDIKNIKPNIKKLKKYIETVGM